MFAALEASGLRVFIWEPTNANHLVPWWKYVEKRKDAVRYAHYRSDAEARAGARRADLIRQLNCTTSAQEKRAIAYQLARAAGTHKSPSRKT